MYTTCGSVLDARAVFNTMPSHNVVSWTAIISTYAKHGEVEHAFTLFEKMQSAGFAPDKVAFLVLLNACASHTALDRGKHLHAHVIESGLDFHSSVGNSLIDMYAKCENLGEARQVFDKMYERDVVSWTTMIGGYAQQGLGQEAFTLFELMQQEGIQPTDVTFLSILQACASLDLELGKKIHVLLINVSSATNVHIGNALVDMYAKGGNIEVAQQAFNKMQKRDVVSWTTMIESYAQAGLGKEAIVLYKQMQQEGTVPDNVTFATVLKVCASLEALEEGKWIHVHLINKRIEPDIFVVSSLVDMYAKCRSIKHSRQVFDEACKHNVVLWNAMIAGYAQHAMGEEAIKLFEEMEAKGLWPDKITFISILKSCSSLNQGKRVHLQTIENGFEADICVQNTLIDMYGNYGSLEDACYIFNIVHDRDVVSWNAAIAGHIQGGCLEKALKLFKGMQKAGVKPDKVTFSSVLKACASLAAYVYGKQIHMHINICGFESDIFVNSALLDMYAKCGRIKDAHKVFNVMHGRNIVSWNAIIAGFAQQGLAKSALKLFRQMQELSIKPDAVTFVSVLYACSHSGLVLEGCYYFDTMIHAYHMTPKRDHYACMVDMLGRAGRLEDALDFINKSPVQTDAVVWMTLLSACKNHGNTEFGRYVFNCALELTA